MGFPAIIESPDVTMQGTTTLTGDDHALAHRVGGSAVIDVQNWLGTNSASNGIFSGYLAGQQPLPINSGTLGTTIIKGTINNSILGSATATNGTFNNITAGTPAITGGTATNEVINSGTLGTPTIDIINARTGGTGVMFGNSILPSQGSLTDSAGGTLTADARAAQIYYSVMGTTAGNRTVGTPTNPSNYQQLTYAFQASGSNNGTLIWGTVFRISQDLGTPLLGTGVSWNYYTWRYNAISAHWDFQGKVLNLV